ncbi:hypothetical protein L9F63_001084, partial [Diploptera punctata]
MELNVQQQITISAWAITYANGRESARRARREFNVALHPSTVGSVKNDCWKREGYRKSNLLEGLALARMQKQRRELWRRSTLAHKNQPAKLHLCLDKYKNTRRQSIIYTLLSLAKRRGTTSLTTTTYSPKIFIKFSSIATPTVK